MKEKGHLISEIKKYRYKYVMLAPFLILFFMFTILPIAAVIVLSFTSFNMLEFPEWAGLRNYISLFVRDDVFLIAVKNTMLFAVITGPISYMMCFFFAWIINNFKPKLRALLTLVFYAPSISGSAFLIWKLIFSSDMYGFANATLISMGIVDEPILWFENADYVLPVLIIVQLWMSLGVSFLSFIAGFQNVDRSLYEAGSVDGIRNRWQELWYLTLPAMKGQLLFGAVMQISSSFSVSTISTQLAGFPSVNYAGHTILTHLQDYGTVRLEMGYASAIAVTLFFIMMISNLVVQKLLRKL